MRPFLVLHRVAAVLASALAIGCSEREPAVVPDLDLERFQGRWYEIARIPRDHDRTCHDTTAAYQLVAPHELELHHQCRLGSSTGRLSEFVAPASAEDAQVPAKLTLDLGLYRGAYWVLAVGDEYQHALVGHPSLSMLWVLSRTASLPASVLAELRATASRDGFNPDALVMTPQSGAAE